MAFNEEYAFSLLMKTRIIINGLVKKSVRTKPYSKVLAFRLELIVLLLLQICFCLVMKEISCSVSHGKIRLTLLNRKEGKDQESIQLPDTFRSKTPKGKKDTLNVTAQQSNHYKQKAKRAVSTPKMAKRPSKITIPPRHTCKDIQWQK